MNKKRIIWLLPVLVMALAMSGCDGDSDDRIGDNLSLGGQVYTEEDSPYTGANKNFTSNAGGSGTITAGIMSFSVGAPAISLKPITTLFMELDAVGPIFSTAIILPTDTLAQRLEFSINISKMLDQMTEASSTKQQIEYIYVDKDCTIKATGIPPFVGADITTNIQDINLSLKQGWNYIHTTYTATQNVGKIVIGKGDLKTCKWVIKD